MKKKTDEQPVRIQDPLLGARFYHKSNGDVDRIEIYVDDGMFPASYDVVFTATPEKLLAMRDELKRLRKIARAAEAVLAAGPHNAEHLRREQALLKLLEGWEG